jgi:hypothetical protein
MPNSPDNNIMSERNRRLSNLIPWPIGSKTLRLADWMISVGGSFDFSELLTTKRLSGVAFGDSLEGTHASELVISLSTVISWDTPLLL